MEPIENTVHELLRQFQHKENELLVEKTKVQDRDATILALKEEVERLRTKVCPVCGTVLVDDASDKDEALGGVVDMRQRLVGLPRGVTQQEI
jgi:uncharacterized protein with PIN domain